jgi:hypothetical protein
LRRTTRAGLFGLDLCRDPPHVRVVQQRLGLRLRLADACDGCSQ